MKDLKPSLVVVGSLVMHAGTRVSVVCLLLVALAVLLGATEAAIGEPSLLVTSQIEHDVKEYDGKTGAFIGNAATQVGDPLSAIIGADGNVLVTDGQQNEIKSFERGTGIYLGVFASALFPRSARVTPAHGM